MLEGSAWVDPDVAGWVRELVNDGDWETLVEDYGGELDADVSFRQMVKVLRSNDCASVVIENRYVDPDYRSEYSKFWSTRFEAVPAFARRLHFFSVPVPQDDLPTLPSSDAYLGYCVVRPTPLGPMGRTVIRPPAHMVGATFAGMDDSVTVFGSRLQICGAAPFMQQDREFLTCSQAALWMCHYTAAKRGLVGRELTADLVAFTPTFLSAARPIPSSGIDQRQIQAVFGATGQPALLYGFTELPEVLGATPYEPPSRFAIHRRPPDFLEKPGYWDRRIISIACRYLNSGYPVLVATEDHAFVLVGWWREGDAGEIHFAANDDRLGPYCDAHPFSFRAPWLSMMIPLPPKVFMTAESAENDAYDVLRYIGTTAQSLADSLANFGEDSGDDFALDVKGHDEVPVDVPESTDQHFEDPTPIWRDVADGMVGRRRIGLRVALRDGSDYKLTLADRGLPENVLRNLLLARLPHYVWVVEARTRDAKEPEEPSVVAEFVYDSTSPDEEPRFLAMLLPGRALIAPPDEADPILLESEPLRWHTRLPLHSPLP